MEDALRHAEDTDEATLCDNGVEVVDVQDDNVIFGGGGGECADKDEGTDKETHQDSSAAKARNGAIVAEAGLKSASMAGGDVSLVMGQMNRRYRMASAECRPSSRNMTSSSS